MDSVECLVVGGGVVGLAIARRLADAGREVMLVEAADSLGTGISSRSSEVIHAGIYYPPGSLKATLCVSGKQALYDYCERKAIPHHRCGKLVVATDDADAAALPGIKATAAAIGVDLTWLSGDEIARLEPSISAHAGLFSPTTGIVDSHSLMRSLERDAEAAGAGIVLACPAIGGRPDDERWIVRLGGRAASEVRCEWVINAAGLGATDFANRLGQHGVPDLHLAKGNYFTVNRNPGFSHLVYPVPQSAGLGVHLTLDLTGGIRFGPDVEWVDHLDYTVDPQRADGFYGAIRRYWPALPDDALRPDYAGIRPKLQAPGETARDFAIEGPAIHGIPGLIDLFGIESPGLTACFAIADHVAGLMR